MKVKIIKYFRDLKLVHNKLVDPLCNIKEKQRKASLFRSHTLIS